MKGEKGKDAKKRRGKCTIKISHWVVIASFRLLFHFRIFILKFFPSLTENFQPSSGRSKLCEITLRSRNFPFYCIAAVEFKDCKNDSKNVNSFFGKKRNDRKKIKRIFAFIELFISLLHTRLSQLHFNTHNNFFHRVTFNFYDSRCSKQQHSTLECGCFGEVKVAIKRHDVINGNFSIIDAFYGQ